MRNNMLDEIISELNAPKFNGFKGCLNCADFYKQIDDETEQRDVDYEEVVDIAFKAIAHLENAHGSNLLKMVVLRGRHSGG